MSSAPGEDDAGKDEVYHDLERRYILLQQDHARCKKEGEELQARLTSSTETSAQDKAKITELQQALAARESAVAEQQRAAEGKEHDVRRLTELLARANKELDSNKAFLHVKDEAVTKLEERLRQVTSEKTALETEVLPTRVDVDRLRRELDGCQVRLRDAEAEVNLRLEELNDERKRASSLRLDLENKLNRAESSVSELQERVTGLEGHLRSRNAALKQKEEEVRAQVKQFSEIESRFDAELEAQRRVARLQEEQRKEAFTARDALLQEVQSLKGAYERQLQQQKERLQAQREKYEKLVEELKQEHQERLTLLEEELRAERKARAALEKQAPVGASALPQTAAARALASLTQDVSLTERLNQLADLETALHKERSEKERFKFFAQQLTKEIGEKAPILAKERRERDLIAKSYDKVVAQLGQATQDLVSTQRRLQQVGEERETLIAKQRGHDQQVEDLSRQVQLLLHERMKARAAEAGTERAIVLASSSSQRQSRAALPASTNQAASRNLAESLLTFKDVQELQTRNAELLAVVRKLTDEKATHQQEGERALVPAAVQHELGNAHKELKRLGEDREAMRAAVATIASERDMYRLLLVKAESRLLAVGETPPSVQSEQRQPNQLQLPATAEAKSAVAGPSAREVELETKLRDAMDRLGRLEELYNEQVKVCESLRTDVSVARQDATLSKADATFYQERYKRSQEDLDKNREDQQSFMSEVQALRAREHALEKALSEKGHDLEAARDEARRFRISLQQATVEKEVAAGAEKRLEQDLVQKRAEVERLTKVLETSQSLSASLTARTDAEREHLENDRKSLQAQLVAMRKDLHEERAAAEAKMTAQTNEVRVAKAKSEEDAKVLSEQRGEILELKVQLNAANEKAASLLRQLEGTQKRLDSLTTSGTVSAIAVREASEKEMELERLTQEMGEVKAKLAVVEGQRDTFKAASEAHERQMRELQARWEASETEASESVAKARAEAENLRKRLEEGLETTRAAVQENHGLREAQNQAAEAAKKEKQDMLEQLEAARKAAEHARGREAELLAEANRASETAEMAKEQYRRELQLHAEAEAGMTELRKELETVRGSKAEVDDRLAQVNASALEKERAYATELEGLGEASRKEKQRADELQEQNKVMHAQLSVLADHLKKLQEDRVHALGARDGSVGAGTGGSAESSGEQASGGSSAMAEADKLRRAIIDLQGVAHYHRTQKELMEAGKEAAEMEAVRYKSTAQQLQKLLDQSRRELAEERKTRPTPESEREHAALLVQVQEISTLKDALAHIRQEKDRLEKRLRAAEKEVVDLQKAAGPAQQKEQQLEAERKALMAERDSLQQEVTAYSERLSSMVTRFHQIDPEVHRKLASDLEELQKARIPELERRIKEAEAKGLEQGKRAEEAEKKVTDLERRAQEGENKAAAALRVTHAAKRQINTLKQESEGLSAEKTRLEGEMATLKAEVESARGEGGTSAAKVKALEEEAARLRVSDAQMKSEITSLKQQAQQQQQQQALAAAKAAAANVPAPSTEPSEQQKEVAKLQAELDAAKGTVQRVKEAGRSALNMVRTWWDGLRWNGEKKIPPDKPSYALHMSHSPWRIGVFLQKEVFKTKLKEVQEKYKELATEVNECRAQEGKEPIPEAEIMVVMSAPKALPLASATSQSAGAATTGGSGTSAGSAAAGGAGRGGGRVSGRKATGRGPPTGGRGTGGRTTGAAVAGATGGRKAPAIQTKVATSPTQQKQHAQGTDEAPAAAMTATVTGTGETLAGQKQQQQQIRQSTTGVKRSIGSPATSSEAQKGKEAGTGGGQGEAAEAAVPKRAKIDPSGTSGQQDQTAASNQQQQQPERQTTQDKDTPSQSASPMEVNKEVASTRAGIPGSPASRSTVGLNPRAGTFMPGSTPTKPPGSGSGSSTTMPASSQPSTFSVQPAATTSSSASGAGAADTSTSSKPSPFASFGTTTTPAFGGAVRPSFGFGGTAPASTTTGAKPDNANASTSSSGAVPPPFGSGATLGSGFGGAGGGGGGGGRPGGATFGAFGATSTSSTPSMFSPFSFSTSSSGMAAGKTAPAPGVAANPSGTSPAPASIAAMNPAASSTTPEEAPAAGATAVSGSGAGAAGKPVGQTEHDKMLRRAMRFGPQAPAPLEAKAAEEGPNAAATEGPEDKGQEGDTGREPGAES